MNLKEYIQKGISFEQYEKDIETIIEKNEESPYVKYYPLNKQRMDRLDKKLSMSEDQLNQSQNIQDKTYLLIITEGWCGDAAQILPAVKKLVESSKNLEEKIVYREENLDLMNQYLTNGGQSIPIIVGVNEEGKELFKWGPRPTFGMDLLKDYKSGKLTKEEFSIHLQKQYNKDKGNAIINELLEKINHA